MQSFAVNAVDEFRAITSRCLIWIEAFEFTRQITRHGVIGVEGEDPWRPDASLPQPKLPLIAMTIKRALKHAHFGK